jgi:DHA1 family bicyclomycin/chloramphenicol resistance-like MFS transporter
VVLAVPLGLSFDGTPVPLMIGVTVLSGAGFLAMQLVARR